MPPGSTVSFDYSLGPAPVSVPSIVGSDRSAAETAITGAGLVPDGTGVHDSATPDEVLSQDPAGGTSVPPGSTVSFDYSLGPAPVSVPVPDLIGVHRDDVPVALAGASLSAGTASTAYSGSVAVNHVISTDPGAGSLVAPGTAVAYTVSLGPIPISAPVTTPTPTPSPTPVTTPTPITTHAPSTVNVDDRSSRFVRKGAGWRAARAGYAARSLWVPVRQSSVKRFALWRPQLDASGQYRILAKVPAKASTRRAVYQVRTTSGWVKRVRNQLKNRGKWVNLGVHTLAARPVVRLTDRTGEASRSGRRVAFDAVKFVPVGSFVGPSTASATTPAAAPPVASAAVATATPTPEPIVEATLEPAATPTASQHLEPEARTATLEPTPEPTTEPVPVASPVASTPEPTPGVPAAPAEPKVEPTPDVAPAAKPESSATPQPTPAPKAKAVAPPQPTPAPTTRPAQTVACL